MSILNDINALITEGYLLLEKQEEPQDQTTEFVLHKHVADKAGLHWDLRIKRLDRNTVSSFAIPEAKIPKGTKDKVLCVTNFEHDPKWTKIKSVKIPSGYGAGTISTLQQGEMIVHRWESDNSRINFTVKSKSRKFLNGTYYLIQPKFKTSKVKDRKSQFLLFKSKTQK